MYPSILNLYGDRGNLMALRWVGEQAGVDVTVRRVEHLDDKADLGWADLIVFNPGELALMPDVITAVMGQRAAIGNYASQGKVIFATGTSGALLAKRTARRSGSNFPGLGLLDMVMTERETPLGDDLITRIDDLGDDIVGNQIQMVDASLGDGQTPFGRVVYGYGNAGAGTADGAISRGVVFTNHLGPVLVKNPWLTLWLIRRALPEAASHLPAPDDPQMRSTWNLERDSSAAILRFTTAKEKPSYATHAGNQSRRDR
jgi:CobQ-like glutamine amidotransferase family enzyme